MRKASKKWADANPEHIRALNQQKWERRQKRLLADPAAYTVYRNRIRNMSLVSKYGITLAQYDEMVLRQGAVCAVCHGRNPDGAQLAVDHCHRLGHVRGILCRACNTAIGQMCDEPSRLRAAVEYLEQDR